MDLEKNMYDALLNLPKMHGDFKNIENNKKFLKSFGDNVSNKVNYLQDIYKLISASCPNVEFKYDLGESNGFDYEKDITFSAYLGTYLQSL